MRVKVITKDFRFSLPVPASMIGFAIRFIPDRVFEELRSSTPQPYSGLVTKEHIGMIAQECLRILKENKGLEIVHVQAQDGTYVSIKL